MTPNKHDLIIIALDGNQPLPLRYEAARELQFIHKKNTKGGRRTLRSKSPAVTRRNRYIALELLNFIWDEDDVLEVERMWREGYSVPAIAKAFKRDPDEVGILIIDRCREKQIKQRPGGMWGREGK